MTQAPMQPNPNLPSRQSLERTISVVNQCFDILFDYCPVMMHSINTDGDLVKVNQRWLATLGYEIDDVLGRKSVDYLTEQSRERAVSDTLPLFWQAGSARSIGYDLVRKDGRVLEVLLDAEVIADPAGNHLTLATLCDRNDFTQWHLASTIRRVLQRLNYLQNTLQNALSNIGLPDAGGGVEALQPVGEVGDLDWSSRVTRGLLEATQDISVSLRTLVQIQDADMHAIVNQQQQHQMLAQTIELMVEELLTEGAEAGGPC